MDVKDRRIEAVGDAACAWHVLDAVLVKTFEAHDALEENGLDELAEEYNGLVGRVKEAHAVAEKRLSEAMEDE